MNIRVTRKSPLERMQEHASSVGTHPKVRLLAHTAARAVLLLWVGRQRARPDWLQDPLPCCPVFPTLTTATCAVAQPTTTLALLLVRWRLSRQCKAEAARKLLRPCAAARRTPSTHLLEEPC